MNKLLLGLAISTVSFFQITAAQESFQLTMPLSKDQYSVGGNINTEKSDGDLIVAGGTVTIQQPIINDLISAGGTVSINTTIGQSVRVAAGNIKINSTIGQDLLGAGGNIDTQSETTVQGTTMLFGESINLHGSFNQVEIKAQKVYLNAQIQDLKIQASEIIVGPQAKITQHLSYTSKEKNPELEAIATGNIIFEASEFPTQSTPQQSENLRTIIISMLGYKFFFLIIFGTIIYFTLPNYLQKIGAIIHERPWVMALRGLILIAILPIIILLLALTGIGVPLAGLFGAQLFFLILLYELASVVALTGLISHIRFHKKDLKNTIYIILTLLGRSIFFTLVSGVDIILALFVFGAGITMKARILKNYLK